ncbi:MAG: hypothetical protein NC090_03960 [Anaeroplasma bactoclasticum]|nr:hypothetical protein [Anaeroplasma bactoclasticum]
MRKVIIGVIMMIFSLMLAGCRLNKIRFNVNEVDSNAIISSNHEDDEYIHNLLINNQNLIIYKSVEQLEESFIENGLSFNKQDIKDKYNQDFFKKKALVIFYNVDSRCGFNYKFKSLIIDNDKLVLTVTTTSAEQGATILNPRLFFIEINEKAVKDYDKIVCKIN